MCGPPRPSSGGRIAVLFPASSSSANSYSVLFHNSKENTQATFRADNNDIDTLAALWGSSAIDLRIEKYGDLTSSPTLASSPLHAFRLSPQPGTSKMEMECELPERLDLGISDTGIVGRQVTVVADGRMGTGVVGYD
ncbi:uncharacterized protein EURHEDRAFT_383209 [Aspergillus ruber CBS 135680]|uniref:Uncharacterized protein n=1 Tax=Aspergillus ruber (strain CBS 135680) TaxID=1388766 RepID=A0A017SPY0_ASPRC|nr:uncharacterized protein EURHEDRAFT_383209 [Aspergillus ruber CBS 135680]EYE99023.1 hypothetical protein EURHEDRAFT_383209 [Aspergillus ruber CBS 135680]